MTASKSSRARNARVGAQAGATRNAAKGGTAVKNASANRSGAAGPATRDRNGRDQARAGATRNGAAARAPRTLEVRDEVAERGPAPWLQITTLVLALAFLTAVPPLAAPAWAPIRAFRARLDFEAVIARFASG